MLNFYKTIDGKVSQIHAVEDGCWVCAICPTEPEVRYLVDVLGLEQDFVRAALDEEESSRVESEEEQTLVIVDVPTAERQDEEKRWSIPPCQWQSSPTTASSPPSACAKMRSSLNSARV